MAERQELDGTAKEFYTKYETDRSAVLTRAENNAKVTIPFLFMEDGTSSQDDITSDYVTGFGAKLVNHLTGKFALSILPPSQSFYRLSAKSEALKVVAGDDEKKKQEIDRIIAEIEDGVMKYINETKFRDSLYPALRLAMVTGECLVEKLEDSFMVISLRNYVLKRDPSGKILHLIIREEIDYDAMPEDIINKIPKEEEEDKLYELFTHCYLDGGKYYFYQEIEGEKFNEQNLKDISDKFINVRWTKVDGEDYSRSFVEEHYATLIMLNKHLEVLTKSAIIGSKTVYTVNPNGMTKLKDFVKAKNGDAIIGNEADIGTIKTNKGADLQQTYQLVQDLKRELSEAFLMSSASIRDAERVTAQEVQLVATELEASFGGIYTSIANDIQMPLVQGAVTALKVEGMEDIDIIITAGVEALGRNVEQAKLNRLIQELGAFAQLVGAEAIVQELNISSFINNMITNSGLGNKGLIKSLVQQEADLSAKQQEMMAQQMMQPALQNAGAGAGQMMAQQLGQEI